MSSKEPTPKPAAQAPKASPGGATVTSETIAAPPPQPVVTRNDAFSRAAVSQILADEQAAIPPVESGPVEEITPAADDAPATPLPDSIYTSEGHKVAYGPHKDDFSLAVRQSPVRFTSENLGIVYHDITNVNRVWNWQSGYQIPAGSIVIQNNALVLRPDRVRILGREDVGQP